MAYDGILLRIKGKVQGVGFRPTVWRLARQMGLNGDVSNNGAGVDVRLYGHNAADFAERLRQCCPPLAQIHAIESLPWQWPRPPREFTILASGGGEMTTQVVPDAATCDACLAELLHRGDRRRHYPFINCTHCGPRFTLIRRMPYDRPNTAMAAFPLCPRCAAEYRDPADRRFHAQPTACPDCGPHVWLARPDGGELATGDAAISLAVRRLLAGEIVAIKGVGGFHLACDATNLAAVARLRRRKHRPSKPLAVMMPNLRRLRRYLGPVTQEAIDLLRSPAAPIVLLAKPPSEAAPPGCGGSALCGLVAPGLHEIGVMLPANPLQHLLLRRAGRPLVMTSGNAGGRPPVLENDRALADLAGIADYWLMHNRDILQRADDSLVRPALGRPEILRRARGYVPDALPLPPGFERIPPVLALGADLKNTFCLLRDGQAIVSQHLGDLADEGISRQQRQALALFRQIWDFTPALIAVDAHPGYLSRRQGEILAGQNGLPCVAILHHHAHLAACLAENGWPREAGPVIGLALDGLGYGESRPGYDDDLCAATAGPGQPEPRTAAPGNAVGQGALWGGECLLIDYRRCEWLGGLPPVALPGGDMAARQPWRNLLAHWLRFVPDWRSLPEARVIPAALAEPLSRAVARNIHAPRASSAGRLFDAIAAALGLCPNEISWEGEAACRLEALAWQAVKPAAPVDIPVTMPLRGNRLDLAVFWRQWLTWPAPPAQRAYAFHLALARGFADMARLAARRHGLNAVALSGGVVQNRLFRELLIQELAGLRVLTPASLPAGDGGVALGQGVIAAVMAAGARLEDAPSNA
ncbi:carbamoyltransferase HypF [Martelella alba]|uniref:Carbamoyltransferase HypF n=1 Tax=Martelella alba TaxID=2590451 RepID=A0ABY2SJK3_9HYPH|nr:carbamoyltransferase HypF [Martelella alba]TKI05377.1 carbamoyltransferase HypF [Martelella alba]